MKMLISKAIEAVLLAGKVIMEVYRTPFDVYAKSDASPVTLADMLASNIIKETLLATGLPFVSEEDLPASRSGFDVYWLVDPLDGTKEFVARNGEFTVNIALIKDKRPILGVIYAPATDTMWYNDAANNVFKSVSPSRHPGERLLKPIPIQRPYTVLVSRSHRTHEVDDYIDRVLRPLHPNLEIDTQGSSLKFARLAEGTADCYVCYSKTKEWDTAAADAILHAVGGKVLRISDGQPLEYSKEDYPNPPFVAYATERQQKNDRTCPSFLLI